MNNFFDNLYNKFLLRDLLGKALPGFVLIAGLLFLNSKEERFWEIVLNKDANLFHYLVLYGLSFAIGTLVQQINPLRSLPVLDNLVSKKDLFSHLNRLSNFLEAQRDNRMSEIDLLIVQSVIDQRERLVVLKDVSGNLSTTGFILGVTACYLHNVTAPWILGLAVFFFIEGWYHTGEQKRWEELQGAK